MKQIKVKVENGKVRLTGNGAYEIKDKIKKYGFVWKDGAWEGSEDKLATVANYVENFKHDKIEIVGGLK